MKQSSANGESEGQIPLCRIRVVLVQPKDAGNIGAAARACMNAGVGQLQLVTDIPWNAKPHYLDKARARARRASSLLDAMPLHATLAEALRDVGFVAGATRRPSQKFVIKTPSTLASLVLDRAARGPVAILFGREDRGLSYEEMDHCNALVTIPSSSEFPSWNLSHAVAVLLAAIRETWEQSTVQTPLPVAEPASHEATERLFRALSALLGKAGYLDPANPHRMMRSIRRIIASDGLSSQDNDILLGIVRQLDWALLHGNPSSG